MRRIGMTVLAVALLAGSVAAFTHTEDLKLERKPVGGVRFDRALSPVCECPGATAALSFLLHETERIDVRVVDDGTVVRELVSEVRRMPGRVKLRWDGRDDEGRVVPDGSYRVRVRLLDRRRTIVVPVDVTVDTRPPRLRLRSAWPPTVVAGDTLEVRYSADERATPILLVDGEPVLRGEERRAGERTARWANVVDELGIAPGVRLSVALEDAAGNLSEPRGPVAVVAVEG